MPEESASISREIVTQGGSYNEQIKGNYIKANIVHIHPENPASISHSTENICSNQKRVAFVIEGSYPDLDATKAAKIRALFNALKKITNDASLTLESITEGSIRLVLKGSELGINRLQELFNSGELTTILGFFVNAVESIDDEIFDSEECFPGNLISDPLKDLLITAIKNKGAVDSDLDEADLSEVNLSKANLSRASLKEACLRKSDLTKAKLAQADLTKADLMSANLSQAKLNKAKLNKANLSGANLTKADLREANLKGANLKGANLILANLRLTNLRGVIIDSETELSQKWRTIHQLMNKGGVSKNLIQFDFSDACLVRINLTEANLIQANFANSDLTQSIFSSTNLIQGNFTRANLTHATFTEAQMIQANLTEANLTDVTLAYADLTSSNLTSADLKGADLKSANLTASNFMMANLAGANLDGANFSGANLSGANLKKINVRGALFFGTLGLGRDEIIYLEKGGAIIGNETTDLEAFAKMKIAEQVQREIQISRKAEKSREINADLNSDRLSLPPQRIVPEQKLLGSSDTAKPKIRRIELEPDN